MHQYQREFLSFCIESDVLKFGEFTLKSGRTSPYFFNAGLFNTGRMLSRLGRYYADAIINSKVEFDVLFGPAYKGIPLVSAVAIALNEHHDRDVPWVFNRKEAKTHGEGGQLVGAALKGKVLLIDDVITAGTAIRESLSLLEERDAELAAVCVSIDRQERGQKTRSAIQEIEQDHGVNVVTIATLADILEYLHTSEQGKDYQQTIAAIEAYKREFGV